MVAAQNRSSEPAVLNPRGAAYGRRMNFDEYRTYDAIGLAKLVADKEVSAAELLTLARERAGAVNPRINAIVSDIPAAAAADYRGPFAGVPFLIKDLAQDYAGLPSSQGSRAYRSLPVAEHSTVVQRWIDAGLLIFGKTNTPEFGEGDHRTGAVGPARNRGIPPERRADRRADRRPRSRPASCLVQVRTTAAGRSASRRPAAGWWASSPDAD